ncbi:MAG TPA: nuclear transport factor 2 family protein [Thermoanaerobaculia bacterium]|nr:nuclear transport factor 2 family protein [Thermoanaerobaculia bacterium]
MPIPARNRRLAAALLLLLPCALHAEDVPALLRQQTQELIDAISAGDAAVWEKYLDADLRYVDETGAVQSKKDMVGQTRPLPAGVSGTIRLTEFDTAVHGDVAVTTYVDDESENFHGHALHCRYRTTETWKKTDAGWRLIAGQVLALREDPPAVALSPALRRDYEGTYELAPGIGYRIRDAGGKLEGQQTGRKPETLLAEAPDVLFVPGKPRYRYVMLRDASGTITGFAQRREAWDLVWTRESGAAAAPGR